MNNISLILMGGLVGIWILSSILDSLIAKASATLSIDVQNEISRAEAAGHMRWRLPDIFGVGLMLIGILKSRGMLGGGPQWGIPAMTLGLVVICSANIFRAWQRHSTFTRFAPNTEASKKTHLAAIATTVAEVALAAAALYFVGDKITALFGGKNNTTGPRIPNAVQINPPNETSSENPATALWIDEPAALKFLQGRGPDYLEALVNRKDVRTNVIEGKKLYRRNDLETMGEFPTYEELGLKKPAEAKK